MEVEFGIYINNEIIETYKASFVGPERTKMKFHWGTGISFS